VPLILAAGLAASVLLATTLTVLSGVRSRGPTRRVVRSLAVWVGLLFAGVAGLGAASYLGERRTHARTAADIVGTWQHKVGETVLHETTFRADGTCELRWLTGPEHERTTWPGTYVLSADGRRIRQTYPRPHDPPGATDPPMWHIEFSDRDHFTTWEDSIKRLSFSYERKK
jgi:hypothetical protein